MNLLSAIQLISAVSQIIAKAQHSQFSYEFIAEIKSKLEELIKYLGQKHDEETTLAKKVVEVK